MPHDGLILLCGASVLSFVAGYISSWLVGVSSEKQRFEYIERMAKRLIEYNKNQGSYFTMPSPTETKLTPIPPYDRGLSVAEFRDLQEYFASEKDIQRKERPLFAEQVAEMERNAIKREKNGRFVKRS